MKPDPIPEPNSPEDARFVYVVTAAGVEALRRTAAAFGSELDDLVFETVPCDPEPRDDDRQSGVAGLGS